MFAPDCFQDACDASKMQIFSIDYNAVQFGQGFVFPCPLVIVSSFFKSQLDTVLFHLFRSLKMYRQCVCVFVYFFLIYLLFNSCFLSRLPPRIICGVEKSRETLMAETQRSSFSTVFLYEVRFDQGGKVHFNHKRDGVV